MSPKVKGLGMLVVENKNEVLDRIIKKLYGVAITKMIIGLQPNIGIKEFKFMMGRCKLRHQWFDVVRELEQKNIIKYKNGRHFIQICLSQAALISVYNFHIEQPSDHILSLNPGQHKQKPLRKSG